MDHATNDTVEVLNVMMRQETSNYLTQSRLYDQSTTIDGECRRLMVAWCIQVSDFCQFDQNTFCVAINILDRFMAKQRHILNENNAQFQLVAMACLYTAVKTNEPMALDPATMSRLSKGAFSAKQIEDMEYNILETIGWLVNVPTALSFADIFLKLLPSGSTNKVQEKFILKLIKHQIIYAIQDSRFLGMPASEIAFTAAYNATMMTVGNLTCQKAYRSLQQSIKTNLLPLSLESVLMLQAQNSGILADFIPIAPQRAQRRKSSSKSSAQSHLSPRCVTMSRQ
mmetsp:Transcript_13897/g.20514  ORF Transcript_13897/g.20514 Transcript_13897/m.20514 type:complete len:283 (+) Transcript_13897:50-898(+)